MFESLMPKTVVARMTSVLFVGILVAQLLGTWLWVGQIQSSERERMVELSEAMGSRIAQTIAFFEKLPKQYRHIVLDQLRDMGGTRFFVSVNKQFINLDTIEESEFSLLARDSLQKSMTAQIGKINSMEIAFVDFDNLKILTGDNMMVSLSPTWKRFALLEPGDKSPFVVIQFPIDADEWMYLAAVVPKGELLLGIDWISTERIFNLSAVSLTVLLFTFLFVRWLVLPLKILAHQADLLGKGRNPRQLEEKGSKEMVATIGAFNSMAKRIQKLITDRERSFTAISHDLKTPLTRARLRVENIEDGTIKDGLIGDLDYLETMVKGSLQIMTDGAEHENTSQVDITTMLASILKKEEILGMPIKMNIKQNIVIKGRALAIERMFSNLINNALTYGEGVEVTGQVKKTGVFIQIKDRGPGLSDNDKENVFKPYYRLEHKLNDAHSGLGMGIARNIANIHGGELELKDRNGGGLIVEVYFPA
jgi:signal transduction histidine kinase|tara:strand:- start:751 stop:2184 length:1434 start_codon:yes stop_codon:yes gene_type:complete